MVGDLIPRTSTSLLEVRAAVFDLTAVCARPAEGSVLQTLNDAIPASRCCLGSVASLSAPSSDITFASQKRKWMRPTEEGDLEQIYVCGMPYCCG
jgi:hypothetical protein